MLTLNFKKEVFEKPPNGYKKLKNATTAPQGTVWYYNGYGFYSGKFHAVLVKTGEENK